MQRHVRKLEAAGVMEPLPHPSATTQIYRINLQPVPDGLELPDLPDSVSAAAPAPQRPITDDLPALPELDLTGLPALPWLPEPVDTLPPLPKLETPSPACVPIPDPGTLASFAALHQRKGYGPVTDATLDKLKAEGERAGMTLPQVLAYCVERRWGKFEAKWLYTSPKGPSPPQGALTISGDAHATSSTPQRLSPDGELTARKLAAFEASRNAPPAAPEQVATHRAKLAALRVSYVAGGAFLAHPNRSPQKRPI